MKYFKSKAAYFFCIGLIPSIAFAGLDSAAVVFKSGNWSVHRDKDAMTDEISCTGIYKDDYAIQLVDDALYIKVRGGVKTVKLRYGEQSPEGMRLADDMEKKIGVIVIDDAEFTKLLASNRLRAQVLTVLDSVNNYDISLAGVTEAVKNIRSGCPDQSVSENSLKAPILCGDKIIERLKAKKVSDEVIEYACSAY